MDDRKAGNSKSGSGGLYTGVGVALGAGVGAAVGVAMGNLAVGWASVSH